MCPAMQRFREGPIERVIRGGGGVWPTHLTQGGHAAMLGVHSATARTFHPLYPPFTAFAATYHPFLSFAFEDWIVMSHAMSHDCDDLYIHGDVRRCTAFGHDTPDSSSEYRTWLSISFSFKDMRPHIYQEMMEGRRALLRIWRQYSFDFLRGVCVGNASLKRRLRLYKPSPNVLAGPWADLGQCVGLPERIDAAPLTSSDHRPLPQGSGRVVPATAPPPGLCSIVGGGGGASLSPWPPAATQTSPSADRSPGIGGACVVGWPCGGRGRGAVRAGPGVRDRASPLQKRAAVQGPQDCRADGRRAVGGGVLLHCPMRLSRGAPQVCTASRATRRGPKHCPRA